MQKQNIIYDDTLVYCNIYFNKVIGEFADQMIIWFHSLTKEQIKQKQLEIDLESIDEHGLTSGVFLNPLLVLINTFVNLHEKKKSSMKSNF